MYIEFVPNRSSPPCVLLRESHWDKVLKRPRKRTLANLTKLPKSLVKDIDLCVKGNSPRPLDQAFTIAETTPHGHVAATLGTLHKLQLDTLIAPRRSRQRDLAVAMIVARILDPQTKLATAQGLSAEAATDTLGRSLGLGSTTAEELYAAMDWLLTRQPQIEAALANRHLGNGSLVLWDLTSVWMEGSHCPLAHYGYSRDGKKGKLQIEFGLMCDADGRPLAVEVFDGNTADPNTVSTVVERVNRRFGLKQVVVVGDRGMLTEARINEDLKPAALDWISALNSSAIRKLVDHDALDTTLFDERDMAQITCEELYPGERLIVCRNPFLAEERRATREALLHQTEMELEQVVAATRRVKRALKGSVAIAQRVERIMAKRKMRKHYELDIRDDGFNWRRQPGSVEAEAALDGFYVIRTSLPEQKLDADGTVRAYKGLARVERAFRSMKTISLKVRPVHHRLADRVRAHVLLCTLAYHVEWHMREALAPLLFQDELKTESASAVAKAERSERGNSKAACKRTENGLPVNSFKGLMKHLATLSKARMIPKSETAGEFEMLSTPSDLQTEAFRLLNVSMT